MLRSFVLGAALASLAVTAGSADEYVHGYTRKDGTYVQPYYRTSPDHDPYNNYSTYPNVNPYTGQVGTHHVAPYGSYTQPRPMSASGFGEGVLAGESSAQTGANMLQSLSENVRRNAASSALVEKYGPMAGDPDAWLRAATAAALDQKANASRLDIAPSDTPLPYSAPTQSYANWQEQSRDRQ